jgi:hypothetical protein
VVAIEHVPGLVHGDGHRDALGHACVEAASEMQEQMRNDLANPRSRARTRSIWAATERRRSGARRRGPSCPHLERAFADGDVMRFWVRYSSDAARLESSAVLALRAPADARSPMRQLDGVAFGTARVVVVHRSICLEDGMPRGVLIIGTSVFGAGWVRPACARRLGAPWRAPVGLDHQPHREEEDELRGAIWAAVVTPDPRDAGRDVTQPDDGAVAAVRAPAVAGLW